VSSFAAGDPTNSTPEFGRFKVCKAGNTSGTFIVGASPVNGGTPSISSPITVPTTECRIVAEDFGQEGVGSNITVTENPATNLQSISGERIDTGGGISPQAFANGDTLFLNSFHGYTITFTNNVASPPPGGNSGCTPGYWKQPQHFDSWTAPYDPTDSFNTTFGIGTNWFPNSLTLLGALQQGGGGANALGRHATAALLNAAKGFYPLSVQQVIDRVQAAYAGTADIEATKDQFERYNELGCPLN
jgi:hypothetical protein